MRSGIVALLGLVVAAGCARARVPAAPDACHASDASSPEASVAGYRYRVVASPRATELCAQLDVPHGAPATTWRVDPWLVPFVRDVSLEAVGARDVTPGAASTDGWNLPACAAARGCRVRYRVLLAAAAHELEDHDRAMAVGDAILSPPSAWLLRPRGVDAPFRLSVRTAPGDSFVSGLALSPAGHDELQGDLAALDDTPYAAFGHLSVERAAVPGGRVDIAYLLGTPPPRIVTWIDGALGAMTSYYGRFPIDHAALLVRLEPGGRVGMGRTMGHGGGAVLMEVGAQADQAALADDWVLVHELVHVSFPEVGAPWAEEGLATYLEPVIRVRSRLCDPDELWQSLVQGLPKGQPQAGDRGLDETDTWGRRYWGGAAFWLLADVSIRERTSNARSLDDVLRAVNKAGGNVAVRWDLDRVLALGDQVTGVDVLRRLRAELGRAPVRTDLDALWRRLGVKEINGRMTYDDRAPLASVRWGIMGREKR